MTDKTYEEAIRSFAALRNESPFENNECEALYKEIMGRRIVEIVVENDALKIHFAGDAPNVKFFDDGQSCCESRYMTCDDDVKVLRSGFFLSASIRSAGSPKAKDEEEDWGVHDIQFLIIETTIGGITIANHNKHNGYYGGFSLKLEKLD